MASKPKRTAGKGRFLVVTGLDDVDRRMRELEPRVQKKHVRRGMRAGMKLVQKAAQANTARFKKASGATRKAIKVRALKSRRRGQLGIEVRVGAGDYVGDRFYAAFLEFGTSTMTPKRFMRPAFASKGPAARDTALQVIRDGIESEVRAMGGR